MSMLNFKHTNTKTNLLIYYDNKISQHYVSIYKSKLTLHFKKTINKTRIIL